MNEASQWRTEYAQQIAPIFASNRKVAAVLLGGSTARGHADQYSDIELGVFWIEPPTDADRQAAADAIDGDLIRLYPFYPAEQVWCDDYMLGRAAADEPNSGVLLEVVHYTTEYVDRVFESVLQHYETDLLKQNIIGAITDGIPLHNNPLIEQWQSAATDYPDELAIAMIKQFAQIDHFWRSDMWLKRGNNLMKLYQSFTQIQQQLLYTLLGLNKTYYAGFKWLDRIIERLQYKPAGLTERLAQIYQVEPSAGIQELTLLVQEVYDLVEQHRPEVDVERLRSIFRYQRPLWNKQPPVS